MQVLNVECALRRVTILILLVVAFAAVPSGAGAAASKRCPAGTTQATFKKGVKPVRLCLRKAGATSLASASLGVLRALRHPAFLSRGARRRLANPALKRAEKKVRPIQEAWLRGRLAGARSARAEKIVESKTEKTKNGTVHNEERATVPDEGEAGEGVTIVSEADITANDPNNRNATTRLQRNVTYAGNGFLDSCPDASGISNGTLDLITRQETAMTARGLRQVVSMESHFKGKVRLTVGDDAERTSMKWDGEVVFTVMSRTERAVTGKVVARDGTQTTRLGLENEFSREELARGPKDIARANLTGGVAAKGVTGIGDIFRMEALQVNFLALGAQRAAYRHFNQDAACLKVDATPEPLSVPVNGTRQIKASVTSIADHQEVAVSLTPGYFSGWLNIAPATAPSNPGAPATFEVTLLKRPSTTYDYTLDGRSRRGKVAGRFYVKPIDPTYDIRFDGQGTASDSVSETPGGAGSVTADEWTYEWHQTWTDIPVFAPGTEGYSVKAADPSAATITGTWSGTYDDPTPTHVECAGPIHGSQPHPNGTLGSSVTDGASQIFFVMPPFIALPGDPGVTCSGPTEFLAPNAPGLDDDYFYTHTLPIKELPTKATTFNVSSRPLDGTACGSVSGPFTCTRAINWTGTITITPRS